MPALDSLFVVQPNNAPDAEVRQLKLTIAALRQALEDGSTARDELSRMIRAEYESEISHLKSTIAAVRAQLEQTERETQEAVSRAIGDAARKGEQIYLHYSGHGMRNDGTLLPGLEADGRDEAIAPTDSGYRDPAAFYLLDKELGWLIRRMTGSS